MTKTCTKCKQTKPLIEFGRHLKTSDGYTSRCKACINLYTKMYRNHLRVDAMSYRNQTPKSVTGQSWRKMTLQVQEEIKHEELLYRTMTTRLHRIRNVNKALARSIVTEAIRTGRLAKEPCEVCFTTEQVESHHPDYSKPLEVKWLCRKHHLEIHRTTKDQPFTSARRLWFDAANMESPGSPSRKEIKCT